MRLKKLIRYGLVLAMCTFILWGCKNEDKDRDSDRDNTQSTTEYQTGTGIDSDSALVEVSANVVEQGYTLAYGAMKSKTEMLIVLVDADNSSMWMKTYNLVKGKTTKETKITVKEGFLNKKYDVTYSDKKIFLIDTESNNYLVYDDKCALVADVQISEGAQFVTLSPDSSRIIYMDKDCKKVYSYNIEGGTDTLVYEFEDGLQILQCIGISSDMNHLIYKYNDKASGRTGYADVQLEEHTATFKENVKYTIGIADNEYVYYDYWNQHKEICFYSLDNPRQIRMFVLDNDEEADNVMFFENTSYFFTNTRSDNTYTCKIYDRDQGILVEKVTFTTNENAKFVDVSIGEEDELVCITTKDEAGNVQIFIWNLTIPSGAIEENLPLE